MLSEVLVFGDVWLDHDVIFYFKLCYCMNYLPISNRYNAAFLNSTGMARHSPLATELGSIVLAHQRLSVWYPVFPSNSRFRWFSYHSALTNIGGSTHWLLAIDKRNNASPIESGPSSLGVHEEKKVF